MAKYGISLKGAEAMEKLSRDLLTETSEILEAAIRLREVCGLLSDDLGVYADGIMSLVQQNTDTLKASKDDIAALAKAAKKRADDIRNMLPENGGTQGAGGFRGSGQTVYRASRGQTQLITVSQLSEGEMPQSEKIGWTKSVLDTSDDQLAQVVVRSMEYYSGTGHQSIHWDERAEKDETKNILRIFDSHRAPVYKGEIYRGLRFDTKSELVNTLKKPNGIWREPGITSFSASKDVAEEFADGCNWGMVLTCKNNKSAIPFRHISKVNWEDEVLSPGGLRNQGWRINYDSIVFDKARQVAYVDIEEI